MDCLQNYVSYAAVRDVLTTPPVAFVLLVVLVLVCLRGGGAYGAPRLFWHEVALKQLVAGASVAVLLCGVLLTLFLLGGYGTPLTGVGRKTDPFSGELYATQMAGRYIAIGAITFSAIGLIIGALKRLYSGAAERTPHNGIPFWAGYLAAFAAVAILGLLAHLLRSLLWQMVDTELVRRLLMIDRSFPTDARVPHLWAAIATVAFLAYYGHAAVAKKDFATPATALCSLFGLIVLIYGFLQFRSVPLLLVLAVGVVLLVLGGRVRYRYRLAGLDPFYNGKPSPLTTADIVPDRSAGVGPSATSDKPSAGAVPENPPGDVPLNILDVFPQTKGKPPLVLVCVSGGGIRAAVWAAEILVRLEQAIPSFPHFTRLIFGASGGMLGAAYYTATLKRPGDGDLLTGASAGGHEIEAKELLGRVGLDSLSATVRQMIFGDIPQLFIPFHFSKLERGTAIERAWHENMPQTAKDFGTMLPGEREGWRPSLVFSPMLVEDGRRLIVTNVDLSELSWAEGSELKQGAPSNPVPKQFYSQSAVEFSRLFPGTLSHLPVSAAVRMSASFPFVTPAVTLPTLPRRRVVDAGYYDNYGVALATAWLDNCLNEKAGREYLEKFGGVLIVQIRDGVLNQTGRLKAIPAEEQSTWISRGMEDLTSPLEAVFSARTAATLFRNDEWIESLSLRLAGELGKPKEFFTMVSFEFPATASLSWDLSVEERANLANAAGNTIIRQKLALVQDWWTAHSILPA